MTWSIQILAAGGALDPDAVTRLLVGLAVLLVLAWGLGELSRRLGQPSVIGEILAGVILGQTILGAVAPGAHDWLFPIYETKIHHDDAQDDTDKGSTDTNSADADVAESKKAYHPSYVAISSLILLSACFLLLVAGMEVDLSSLKRQGWSTLQVAMIGMALPLLIGGAIAWIWPNLLLIPDGVAKLPFALFVGIALSITALPVIAKILMDLNLLRTDMGMLVLSAAMVVDVVGWVGFAVVKALLEGGGPGEAINFIIMTAVFVVLMLTVVRLACSRIVTYLQARWEWPVGVLGFVLIFSLFCAGATEWIGVHSIFGAFLAGVAIGDSDHLRERTRETINQFVTSIFAPIFFASIALRVDFFANFNIPLVLLIFAIAMIGKTGGTYLGARLARLSKHEAWAVGFGMAAQGSMGVILAELAFAAELIGEALFVAIVVTSIVTSLISGPAIRRILQPDRDLSLADYLSEAQFVASMQAATRREAIVELAKRAAVVGNLPEEKLIDAVWKREMVMNTSLGMGLAVPHAKWPALAKPVVVIGRSEDGVDFDALDGKSARLICLLVTSEDDPEMQIDLLRLFAEAFNNPGRRTAAMGAKKFNEFLAILKLPHEEKEGGH